MKRILLSTSLIFAIFLLFGQRNPQTLLGGGAEFTSGFGGFMLHFPSIDGQLSAMTGGGGAVLVNNTFFFGGYGMGLADDVEVRVESTNLVYDVDHGHGGFYVGYVIMPESLVHFGISSKIGWGEISLREKPNQTGNYYRERDKIFVVAPQAEIEINMTEWFKFNFGVGYQFTNGVDNLYYQDGDFDGLSMSASFLFGWFR